MPHRNWLITGASSGFGRIMTEQLLARGDRVAGTVRDRAAMNDLQARYGELLWLAELDLSDTLEIRGIVDRAYATLGRIEVVVSNAGYRLMGAAEEMPQ
jgi:NAD(P)-dependent dehydrogenase (short-subunit alcohol dehydrogenase family)